MIWLVALALATPDAPTDGEASSDVEAPRAATTAAIEALTLHAGQGKMSDVVVEEARRRACALGSELVCDGWPDLLQLQAACVAGDAAGCIGVAWDQATLDGRLSEEARDPAKAAMAFASACNDGHLRACVAHAQLSQRGIGVEAAPEQAAEQFRGLCERGETWSCVHHGKALQVGMGVPADPAYARERFDQACTAELPAGCGALALAQHLGVGGPKDVGSALLGYRGACERGFLPSCDNLNMLYDAGLTDLDAGPRRTVLAEACEEGRAAACGHLGDALIAIDLDKAVAAYQVACGADLARGCRGVGLHALATGDSDKAAALLRRSCEAGEPEACSAWGGMLAVGDGVERDLAAAFEARKVACTKGEGAACWEAARQLHKGKGVPRDRAASRSLLDLGCQLDDQRCCARVR